MSNPNYKKIKVIYNDGEIVEVTGHGCHFEACNTDTFLHITQVGIINGKNDYCYTIIPAHLIRRIEESVISAR
jgi:hypothetical protein